MDLTEKTNPIHSRDYPSNKLSNHREHGCNFQKLGTKGEILPNHRDYPCILLLFFSMFDCLYPCGFTFSPHLLKITGMLPMVCHFVTRIIPE
ncbi:hypothetical protein Hanom_Chr07g00610821 [Helianthus anomalus]